MAARLATVFGGSGFVGRQVVRELARRGWRVRAAVRRPHAAGFLKPMGDVGQIHVMGADILDRDQIDAALHGAEAVVNTVGVLYQKGRYSFEAVHVKGAAAIAELAATKGIARLAHLSAIGADEEADALYARTKGAGEAAVRAAFPDATILRPSIIFGPGDAFFNRFAAMARFSPFLPAIGFGRTRFQPVYVDDVANAACESLDRPATKGRTFELGGPAIYSFSELMQIMLEVIERKRILVPIPFAIAELMGFAGQAVGRLTPWAPPITVDQVRLLKRDNVVGVSGEPDIGALEDFGFQPRALEPIIPVYLERFRKYGQFEPSRVG